MIARVAFFILIGFQYYIISEFAAGRFRPLVGDDPYAASLYTLHNLAKSAVFCVFYVIAWMYVFRTKAVTAGPAYSFKLTALIFAIWALLLFNLTFLSNDWNATLTTALRAKYISASFLLIAFAVLTLFVLVPKEAIRNFDRQTIGIAVIGFLAYAAHQNYATWFGTVFRRLIEDTTLNLSVWFHSFLSPITPDISFDHRGIPILSDASFAISLNPPCAGYQGMFTSLALLLSYVLFFRQNLRLARSFALVTAAIGAVFMMNSMRIAVLFEIGVRYSPEIAVEGFHSNFGTLSVFLVVAAAMVMLNIAFFRRTALAEGPIVPAGKLVYPTNNSGSFTIPTDTVWQMAPLALVLVAILVAGLFVGTFNWLYPIPIVVGTIAAAYVWPRIRATFAETVTWHATAMGVLIYVIWIAMVPRDPGRAEMIMESLQQAPVWAVLGWIFFRIVGSGIIVPILEELAFRGGVMGLCKEAFGLYLTSKATIAIALIVSSVAFGLMHSTVLVAAIAGLGYGLIALQRNKIGDAIIAHAVTNLLIAGHVLVLFDWSLW
jgi:uncharacterized protein